MVLFYLFAGLALVSVGAFLWQKYGAKAEADKLLLQQKYTGVKAKVEADAKKVEKDFLVGGGSGGGGK